MGVKSRVRLDENLWPTIGPVSVCVWEGEGGGEAKLAC